VRKKIAAGAKIAKPPFLRIFTSQGIVLVLVAALVLPFDWLSAYSVLLGGLISIVPNGYLASLAYRFTGARAATDVAGSLYRGEIGKFVLTAVMFALVFVLVKPLSAPALFAAFILTTVLNWVLVLKMSKF
jgi:ATP synthase protein I